MKSIFRLYANTSKGNDNFLYKQLLKYGLKPRFDPFFKAFYFDSTFHTLFDICHRSLFTQNLYIQIGKPFAAVDQQVFKQKLKNIQFKNYLNLNQKIIEKITLNIFQRQSGQNISNRVMQTFIIEAIQKQIVKKQYSQLVGCNNHLKLPYEQIKQIVERKWQFQEIKQQNDLNLLQNNKQKNKQLPIDNVKQNNQTNLVQIFEFNPELTLYILKNKAKLLLKVNNEQMYKFGWKKQVGWAPIRQSIVASVINQSKILQNNNKITLWDPFCGSGTISLVTLAIYYEQLLRINYKKSFNFNHWPIFKQKYIEQYYLQLSKKQNKQHINIICTDIDINAANHTLSNLKCFSQNLKINSFVVESIVKKKKPTQQWTFLNNNLWSIGCGDFQQLSQSILINKNINIITNLPYIDGRSAQKIPLLQLNSIYKRFSNMILKNKQSIQNVFVIIDNNITHPSHFLNISKLNWNLVQNFDSGGRPIAMYAWSQNKIKVVHDIINIQQSHQIKQNNQVKQQIQKYKNKLRQIQKKQYKVPSYLLNNYKRGWKRVLQKRRRRHLLAAYQIFSRKRDKMIALKSYYQKRRKISILKRSNIWKKRNIKILSNQSKLLNLQKPIKKQFQKIIQQALQRQSQFEQKQKQKQMIKKKQQQMKNKRKIKSLKRH